MIQLTLRDYVIRITHSRLSPTYYNIRCARKKSKIIELDLRMPFVQGESRAAVQLRALAFIQAWFTGLNADIEASK